MRATNPAAELASTYAASAERLRDSPFKRPLELRSSESAGRLAGDVHALVQHPFAQVSAALAEPANWCDALALAPNIRRCKAASRSGAGAVLAVRLGRLFDQPADAAYPIDFAYASEQPTPRYFRIRLAADEGPMGTEDYRISLEGMPAADGGTFVHFSYAYAYGWSARLATQAYLATKGRNKIGFTVIDTGDDGRPRYVDGLRGAVERNAMRYYLAIDAYLDARSAPRAERFERSLQRWLDAIEQYPQQLAETDRAAYAVAKRAQRRQR